MLLFLKQILHRDCPIEAGGIFVPLQTEGGNQYRHDGFLVPDNLLYPLHSLKKGLVVTLCDLEVSTGELHLTQTDETVVPVDNQIYLKIGRDVPWRFLRNHTVNPQGVLNLLDVNPAKVLESKAHP